MNIVLQHWTGELDELGLLSTANIKRYAEKVGAEYRLLRGNVFHVELNPPCQKLYMLDSCWDVYDDVLMLDMDMFAVTDENVFELPGIGLFSEYTKGVFDRCRRTHPELTSPEWGFWGGAIWKLSRELRQRLRAHINESDLLAFNKTFHDEGIMHRLACLAKVKQDRLPDRWCQCSYLPNPEKAAMIHVRTKITPNGPKRSKIENYRALKIG